MITKEEFLNGTTEDEVFSIIHEFKERYNELVKEEKDICICGHGKNTHIDGIGQSECMACESRGIFRCDDFNPKKEVQLLDKDIGVIAEQMITNIKSKEWEK